MGSRLVHVASIVFIVFVSMIWWRQIPVLGTIINLDVLLMISVTLSERWPVSVALAVCLALLHQWFSVLSGPVYLISYLSVVGAAMVLSQRIVASRSTVSFIATVAAASAVGSFMLWGTDAMLTLFDHQRLHLPTWSVAWSAVSQVGLHPFILVLIWRLLGRSHYATLTHTLHQTF